MKPSRQADVRSGKRTFSIYANLADIEALVDGMEADLEQAARPAAQAMAEVLYQAVRTNVSALGRVTGNLYASIYQKYSPENSGPGRATYHISWRTGGSGVRAPHGHLVEFGHLQRYEYYKDEAGHIRPMPKPENRGKVPPWIAAGLKGPRKGEAQAWYQPRAGGPIQVPAHPFIRSASAHYPEAVRAAEAVLHAALGAR